MKTVQIKTSWGPIALTLTGNTVTGCTLPFLNHTPHKPFVIEESPDAKRLKPFFPTVGKQRHCGTGFLSNIENPHGTDFQKAVWKEMQKIPSGQTRTYGEIAAAIGRPNAVRAVGTACGANPIPLFIPCHRVVAKTGIGGFGSGLPWKKLLLEMEGCCKGVLES